MTKYAGKCQRFWATRPDIESDWDATYDALKTAYADLIASGNVGYDDRTKLFMCSVAPGWNEWGLLFYNQNRLALNIANQAADVAEQIKNLQGKINEHQPLQPSTVVSSTVAE